ncbi:MAG: carboxypeptidase regulatory-like domain-containing protein [Planctomycetes bacterium]|nr:carboxypeptidase regulatory-like domain-containing protein [Planctomycetota bacterium]
MSRAPWLVFALVVVAALAVLLWREGAGPAPTAPPPSAPTGDSAASSGDLAGGDAAAPAAADGLQRTAVEPTPAPANGDGGFAVEGMILADPQHPDLSDARILVYAGEPNDAPGFQMPSFDPRGNSSKPAFVIRGEPIASVAADATGNFALQTTTPHLRLVLEHDVYLLPMPEIVHVPVTERAAHVVLAPVLGACVRGRLFGERTAAVGEVRLLIEPDPMAMSRDPRLMIGAIANGRSTATPSANGEFTFRGVIPNTAFVLETHGGGAFGELRQPPLRPGENREVALTVRAAADLEVTVVDGAGAPVAHARVTVTATDAGGMFARLHAQHGQTDADGRCRFDSLAPANVTIEAEATARVAADATLELKAAPTENTARLELVEGGVVTGTVVDPTGAPVAGAYVAHQPMTEIPILGDLASQLGPTMLAGVARGSGVRTDEQGHFRLAGLADENEFLVVAAHDDWSASYTSGVEMGDTDVEVRLAELGGVFGTVVAADGGEPIAEFAVRVTKTMFLVMTSTVRTENVNSTDGAFRLTGIPPGSYTAYVEAEGRGDEAVDFTVSDSGSVDLGTIELPLAAILAGTVRDEDGVPIRGALVHKRKGPMADNPMLSMFSGGSDDARTDRDGHFRIVGMSPGKLQLVATADGYASGRSERVEIAAGATIDGVDIVLGHGGSIHGRLVTAAGQQPRDFMVMVQNARSQTSFGAELAADGTFTVDNLDPGTYVAQAMAAGIFDDLGANNWKPGRSLDFGGMIEKITSGVAQQRCTVRAGETTEVTIDAGDLVIGTRWDLRVEVAGKPLKNGLVEAVALDGGAIRAAMLSDGRGVLANVEPGTFRLQVRSGLTMAQVGAPQDVEFPAGATEHSTTIELPGGELRGRVVDAASGDPLRHALVRLIHEDAADDDPIGMALSDADGRFVFSGLADGRYGVMSAGSLGDQDGGAAERRGIDVQSGTPTTEIELRSRAAASASAVVTSEAGAPIAGATALCVDRDGRPLGALGLATTGPDGRAWFGGMPRGEARVVARAPGYAPGASELRQLDPERAAEFPLILTDGAVTTLQVVDDNGRPLNGATIAARCDGGPWLPAMLLVERTGPGTYELGRLGRGSWEVRVQHPAIGTVTCSRAIGGESAVTIVAAP